MDWFNQLPIAIQSFLIGAAGDTAGGLAVEFTKSLVGSSASTRKRFQTGDKQQALQRALVESLAYALTTFGITDKTAGAFSDHFQDWLFAPAVVSEFRFLIAPREGRDLDISLLREEFEASGLDPDELGFDFEEMIRGMVGAFYTASAGEAELVDILQSGLLFAMVDRMDALRLLSADHLESSQKTLSELVQIRELAAQIANGTGDTALLLIQIRDLLTKPDQGQESPAKQQDLYQTISGVLDKVELIPAQFSQYELSQLLDWLVYHFDKEELKTIAFKLRIDIDNLPADNKESFARELIRYLDRRDRLSELVILVQQNRPHVSWPMARQPTQPLSESEANDLQIVLERLNKIAEQLDESSHTISDAELDELAKNYCQRNIEQFKMLTFRGIAPPVRQFVYRSPMFTLN
ncbi:MAG: hypothetical protein R6X18_09605 [Chloroflexota bacterium]|jgi:hypothetical protein